MSKDAGLLVTGSGDHRFVRTRIPADAREIGPGSVRLWDARTGRQLRRLGDPAEQVLAVAVSPDGTLVASGVGAPQGHGAVNVWNAETGELVWSAADHPREALAVAFSPDGRRLAVGDAQGTVVVREVRFAYSS